jgi:endoglycosylceramidase
MAANDVSRFAVILLTVACLLIAFSAPLLAGGCRREGSSSPPIGFPGAAASTVAAASTTAAAGAGSGARAWDLLSPLRVQGLEIRDRRGRQVLLRGGNLSNRSKKPPFTWHKPEYLDSCVRWGFDHVRLLITWEAVEPTDGKFDDVFLNHMCEVLRWCAERGLYVIVDMHQDMWSRDFGGDGAPPWAVEDNPLIPNRMWPFPANYANPDVVHNFDRFWKSRSLQQRFLQAWERAIRAFRGSPAVVGYDLLNEPFFGSKPPPRFEAGPLSDFYARLIPAIRKADPHRIIFVEPHLLVAAYPSTHLRLPAEPNLVYAPHFYDLVTEARWMLKAKPAYRRNPVRIERCLRMLCGHAAKLGIPLWLGEWGIERRRGGALEYVEDHMAAFDRLRMHACWWNINPVEKDLCNLAEPGGPDHPVAEVVARPYPRAVAGNLRSIAYNAAAEKLDVEWAEANPPVDPMVPSLISLPPSLYAGRKPAVSLSDPSGCWRWEYDDRYGILAVWADRAQKVHRLTVTPRQSGASRSRRTF